MNKRCASCGGTLQLGIDGGGLCAVCLLQLGTDGPADTDATAGTDIFGQTADPEPPHYRTVSVLGGSPLGTTYLAEGAPPLPPLVAVKVLNRSLDSDVTTALRTAVAQMGAARHPALVRVLESGLTPAGAPYFARDYIRGRPLDRHFDQAHLSFRDRLAVMRTILVAIAAAHAVGVAHGAIKRTNVLAVAEGGRTEPRVLDLGVLYAMSQLGEASQATPSFSKDVRDSAGLIRASLATATLKDSERSHAIAINASLARFVDPESTFGLSALVEVVDQALTG